MEGAGHDQRGAGRRAHRQLRDKGQVASADVGTAFLEALAWAADRLSCYAERVADEAYLSGTRRGRGRAHPRRPRAYPGIDVDVDVDGTRWRQVPGFGGSRSDDLHYIVRHVDGGATVVEFGDGVHGRRPASGSAIGVQYRAGTRYSSVLLEQGRVILDTDHAETPPAMTCGVHRGRVTDNVDPMGEHRLRVQVPSVNGDQILWASACLPAGGIDGIPNPGDDVWIAFESGDPALPVWIGRPAS